MDQVEDRAAAELPLGAAEHHAQCRVGVDQHAAGRGECDAHRRVGEGTAAVGGAQRVRVLHRHHTSLHSSPSRATPYPVGGSEVSRNRSGSPAWRFSGRCRIRGTTHTPGGTSVNEFDLVLPTAVDVREVGMRDGLQLEAPLPLEAKLAMLEALVATGVRRIEATSFVSPKAVPALADADQLAAELSRWGNVHWSALVANPRGAVRAVNAGVVHLEYVVSASDGHSRANAGRPTAEAVAAVGEIAGLAHRAGGSLEVIIATAWDCPFDGRTPIPRTVDVARAAVTAGADQLCLGDTIGTTTPLRVVQLLDAVRRACPGIPVGVHFHDTRGTGQANALAAIQAGVTQLDSSVGGLGGCPFAPGASGNIATEELVYMLEESGVSTGLDLDAVLDAARVTERAVGHELPSSLYRAGGRSVPRSAAGADPAR